MRWIKLALELFAPCTLFQHLVPCVKAQCKPSKGHRLHEDAPFILLLCSPFTRPSASVSLGQIARFGPARQYTEMCMGPHAPPISTKLS